MLRTVNPEHFLRAFGEQVSLMGVPFKAHIKAHTIEFLIRPCVRGAGFADGGARVREPAPPVCD